MSGFLDFSDGQSLFGDQIDAYLMRQAVMRFPSPAALTASLTTGIRLQGMQAYATSTDTTYMFNGVDWTPINSGWQAFTPVWSGPSALVIGNGTLTCRWKYQGGQVCAHYYLLRGSTTNVGTTSYNWTLPVASANGHVQGFGWFRDSSASQEFPVNALSISTTAIVLVGSGNSRLSNAVPVVPAVSDEYSWTMLYEPLASAVNLT